MSEQTNQLNSNDLTVLQSLGSATGAVSQREIARRTGLSVGLINAVLKKLARTGYIKTSHLNRRSIEYLLTPEGFTQTALRSYRFVRNTLRNFRSIQQRLESIVGELQLEGVNEFYIHGDGDLADFITSIFGEQGSVVLRQGLPKKKLSAVVLNADPAPIDEPNWRVVNLVRELGEV